MSDETELEVSQQESAPAESAPIDYRTEYEKAVAESKSWQERHQQLDGRYRAQQGQLGPAQRELARLKALVDSGQKKPETPAEWARFSQDFPEEAKAHEARLTPLQREMEELRQKNAEIMKRMEDRERLSVVKERYQNVLSKHPDFLEVLNSKEFSDFGNSLPRRLREAFEDEEDPDDEVHIHVLNMFKAANANRPATAVNPRASYVQSQGVAPRAKQTQAESTSAVSSDPNERRYLEALALANKRMGA